MSVLVCDREESRFEPVMFAADLRETMRGFLKRNFGIKKKAFLVLMQNDPDGTYRIYLKNHKQNIDELTARVSAYVRAANTIYSPKTQKEYELRRAYQTDAISLCEDIIGELQAIVVYFKAVERDLPGFHININANREPVKAVDREIELIKNWRQGDNRFRKFFRTG